MAQVAMAWVLDQEMVDSPIVGCTKSQHLTDAVASLDLELTDDEIARLEQHYKVRQVNGIFDAYQPKPRRSKQ